LCSSRLTQAFKTYRPQADLSPQENTLKLSHSEETHNISSPNTRPISTVTRLRDERSEFKSLQGYEFFTFLPRTLWCRTKPGAWSWCQEPVLRFSEAILPRPPYTFMM
jgi:hypothetical protein